MATSKTRQRALARAKAERQIARRAAAARRRRQWQAGIGGGVVLVLAVVGVIWAAGGFKKAAPVANDCAWTAADTTTNTNLKDVGLPPVKGVQKSGSEQLTITTNQGVISAVLDPAKAPCAVASFAYLAGKKFFDGIPCHRLVVTDLSVLQCGDPPGTSKGGPAYQYAEENLGVDGYPRGSVAVARADSPDASGSQFFINYADNPFLPAYYTRLGTITKGMDIIDKVAAGGLTPLPTARTTASRRSASSCSRSTQSGRWTGRRRRGRARRR